jgi:hypothetical protein
MDNIPNYDSYILIQIFITTFNGSSCNNFRNENVDTTRHAITLQEKCISCLQLCLARNKEYKQIKSGGVFCSKMQLWAVKSLRAAVRL